MTPEEIQAALTAQIEFNRQTMERQQRSEDQLDRLIAATEADRHTANDRMSRTEQQTEQNGQSIQAVSRDLAQLVATQQEAEQRTSRLENAIEQGTADLTRMIGTLSQMFDSQGQRIQQLATEAAQDRQDVRIAIVQITQVLGELQAANQRQERINDFLLRNQGQL